MKTLLYSQLKCLLILPLLVGLLSFTASTPPLPPGVSCYFVGPYNRLTDQCSYPLQFNISKSNTGPSGLIHLDFMGNGPGPDGVEVTGVNGGSNVQYDPNNVRLTLAAGEHATVYVTAFAGHNEQNVGAYVNDVFTTSVNVVFSNHINCP